MPPLYDFLAGVERFRTDPDPDADYDLLVVSDCGSLDRIGDVRGRHAELFERLPRVVIDHHASNDAAGEADWIEPAAAATCEMVALLAARLGAAARRGDGALAAGLMAGIVMDTATFAHPNATPRTLAVVGGARRGRRAAVGHLAPALPLEAGRPAAAVRPRPRPARAPTTGASSGPRCSTPTWPRPGRLPPQSEGIIDLLAQADEAEVAILFKEAGAGDAHQRPDQARRGRRDGADRHVRWRRARPRGRGDRGAPRRRRHGRAVLAEARRLAAERRALTVAHKSLGPGLDGILVVDKPVGPTSHDIVGLVRRLAATKRVGHGGTLDPFASGVLPLFLGRGTRVVEFHLADRSATGRRSASGPRRRPTTSKASSRRRRARRRPRGDASRRRCPA